jgi:hypothetical protein
MLRWILFLLTLAALLLMVFGPSPGWVALGLFSFLFGSIASTLAFAQARIDAHARPDAFVAHPYSGKTDSPMDTGHPSDPSDTASS